VPDGLAKQVAFQGFFCPTPVATSAGCTSLSPYLTTRDTGFEVALAEPAAVVQYVLVTPDDDGLTLDADVHPPAGFQVDWSWGGYTLYRRAGATRLPVRYDRLLPFAEAAQ